VAYRPAFFGSGQLHAHAADWLADCWSCDDQYISGHLALEGVPIVLVPPGGNENASARGHWPELFPGKSAAKEGHRWRTDTAFRRTTLYHTARLMARFGVEGMWRETQPMRIEAVGGHVYTGESLRCLLASLH
jgi:hypothetical protein